METKNYDFEGENTKNVSIWQKLDFGLDFKMCVRLYAFNILISYSQLFIYTIKVASHKRFRSYLVLREHSLCYELEEFKHLIRVYINVQKLKLNRILSEQVNSIKLNENEYEHAPSNCVLL